MGRYQLLSQSGAIHELHFCIECNNGHIFRSPFTLDTYNARDLSHSAQYGGSLYLEVKLIQNIWHRGLLSTGENNDYIVHNIGPYL